MLEFIPGFENRRMNLLHRHAQLSSEPVHNIPLPRIILGINPRLDLFVVDYTHAEALLRLRSVERRPSLLDLSEQLLPIRKRVAEAVEHVFGFEIPEGLELQPLGYVLLKLLDLVLDQRKRMLEGIIREPRKLWEADQRERKSTLLSLLTNEV
jgi:hypothetical protein